MDRILTRSCRPEHQHDPTAAKPDPATLKYEQA